MAVYEKFITGHLPKVIIMALMTHERGLILCWGTKKPAPYVVVIIIHDFFAWARPPEIVPQ
jgi:hypothetical protein